MALHLFCLYTDPERKESFEAAWRASGHRLDMGKSCVRFKKIEKVPLDVIGKTIASIPVDAFLERYEASIPTKKATKKA